MRFGIRWATLLVLCCLAHARSASAQSVEYVYDDLGRLAAVIDPTSDTATYTYDAVGNVLSIGRYASTQVSIVGFSPTSGPVSTVVKVRGTGFSTTANLNSVTFAGTAATVSAATATELTVIVPTGATSGSIAVTAPAGSATSSGNFTIAATSTAPSITGFSPAIIAPGSALAITGTNFDATAAMDRLSLNVGLVPVLSASATTLGATVGGAAASGKITVTTRGGSATSVDDLFVTPPGYTASQVDATARTTLGTSQNVTINTTSKIGLLLFDATAGQRVSVGFSAGTITGGTAKLYDAAGGELRSTTLNSLGRFMDATTLSRTGTYQLLLAPSSAAPATTTVIVNNIQDLAGSLTLGTAQPLTFTTPGQNARYSFSGTAGHRYSGVVTSSLSGQATATIYDVDGQNGLGSMANGIIEPVTATSTGSHYFVVDPQGTATGNASITAYDVPNDLTGTLTPNGSTVTGSITTPGQNATYNIGTPTNPRVSLVLGTGPVSSVTVRASNGSTVGSGQIGVFGGFVEPWTYAAGQTVLVDPQFNNTGGISLALYDVPADLSGTLTPGGGATNLTFVPGQNALYAIGTPTNARVSAAVTGGPVSAFTVKTSTGSVVKTAQVGGTGTTFIEPWIFASGQTVTIDPSGGNSGTAGVTLYDVPNDTTGTVTIGGSAATFSTSVPGQNGTLTFSGTASQQVTVRVTNSTISNLTVKLLSTDGTTVLASKSSIFANFNLSTVSLPSTGTYTISIDPFVNNTGSATIAVTNP